MDSFNEREVASEMERTTFRKALRNLQKKGFLGTKKTQPRANTVFTLWRIQYDEISCKALMNGKFGQGVGILVQLHGKALMGLSRNKPGTRNNWRVFFRKSYVLRNGT